MKNIIRLSIFFAFFLPRVAFSQEQATLEPAKVLKNAFSMSGGTSFCKDRFFNPTFDFNYSRLLWKGLFWEVGFKWQHHTIEKVNYSTGEYKWNYYYAFTGHLGLGWKFDINERFSLSPSVTWGRSIVLWDYYTSQSAARRRSHSFSLSADYVINRHWSTFCTYSYTIQGKDIYLVWTVWNNKSRTKVENMEFAKTGATNEFNCHDLKLGISFRF